MKDIDSSTKSRPRRKPPGITPEAREGQLIALAYDVAEQQMYDGTVSSQTLTHFLKMGSSREKLEQSMVAEQTKLMRIKAEAIEAQKASESLYREAMNAFRRYHGDEQEAYDE